VGVLACWHPCHRGLGIILDGSIPKMPEGFRVDHLLESFRGKRMRGRGGAPENLERRQSSEVLEDGG